MEKQFVLCNKCGKTLKVQDGICQEDGLFVTKHWGYFSEKDLQIHHFNLCEKCYDSMIRDFLIPVEVTDKKVVLE